MTIADVVLGPIQRVTHAGLINAVKTMKLEKVAGPSEVNTEMKAASGKVGVVVVMKWSQRVLGRKRIPDEWKKNVVVPIYKKRRYFELWIK